MAKLGDEMKFWKLQPFEEDYGKMSPEDYDQLTQDILERKGTLIPGASGLLEIAVDNTPRRDVGKDPRSEKYGGQNAGWLVVYAVYKRHRLVVLVEKYKYSVRRKKFNFKEQQILASKKIELDKLVEDYLKNTEVIK